MATPQDLLMKAKSRMGQVGGGSQPNTGGSRGAPGRGGIAARPAAGGGLQGRPARRAPDGINTLSDDGTMQTAIGPGRPSPPRPGAEPLLTGRRVNLDADPAQVAQKMFPGVESIQRTPPPKPAWQQLQEQGVGGQGSAAANRAKLAEVQGYNPAGGGAPRMPGLSAPDQMPGGAPDMPVTSPEGPTMRSFPGFKPRPGAEPALAAGPGLTGGPRPQSRMPVENIMDLDGPPPAGPGGGMGGGFGDIAAVAAPYAAGRGGAGVANRFQPRMNPLR